MLAAITLIIAIAAGFLWERECVRMHRAGPQMSLREAFSYATSVFIGWAVLFMIAVLVLI